MDVVTKLASVIVNFNSSIFNSATCRINSKPKQKDLTKCPTFH